MISFFRHHLQGRFLRYTVYAVSFLVVFPTSLAIFFRWFDIGGSDWVIKVNSSRVGYAQYQQREQEINSQIEQLKSMLGDKAQAVLAANGLAGDPKTITINHLIMQTLFDSSAKKVGIYVSPSYRQLYMMRSLPRQFLLPNGEINRALVEQTYHVSFEQLEQQQEQRIKEETLLQFTNGAIYLPLFVLKDYFMREYADHKFLIAKLPLARFIEQEKKQVFVDKDLQEFFAAENRRSRRYFVPERRSGIVWTFSPDQYGITITDNQIKRYYDRNKPTEFILAPA